MKNSKMIRMAPSYWENFKCIGGACEDTCCAGWTIEVDEVTYKKYKKVKKGLLRTRLDKDLVDRKQKSTPEFAAKIKMKNNRCAFLSQEGWCDIYSELGEAYLSHTCTLYPRTINKINNQLEYGLTFSCPEATRVILMNEAPIYFDAVEKSIDELVLTAIIECHEDQANRWQDYFKMIRSTMIEMIQDRRFNIEERVERLGAFMLGLTRLTQKSSLKQIPSFVQEYRKGSLETKGGERKKQCEISKQEIITLLEKIRTLKEEKKLPNKRYEECLDQTLEGLQLTNLNVETAYDIYKEGEKDYFQAFLKEKSYLLENYLVNYIFERCIPLDGDTPFVSYERMKFYYCMLKIHLIGMAQVQKGIDEDSVITLVQSFSKTFDHHEEYLRYFAK